MNVFCSSNQPAILWLPCQLSLLVYVVTVLLFIQESGSEEEEFDGSTAGDRERANEGGRTRGRGYGGEGGGTKRGADERETGSKIGRGRGRQNNSHTGMSMDRTPSNQCNNAHNPECLLTEREVEEKGRIEMVTSERLGREGDETLVGVVSRLCLSDDNEHSSNINSSNSEGSKYRLSGEMEC